MIANEVNGVTNIVDYEVGSIYKSKRNKVYSITNRDTNISYVVKEYNSMEIKSKDIFYLKLLNENNIAVPKVIYEGVKYIVMEKLDNNTFLDQIIYYEENKIDPCGKEIKGLFRSLFNWLNDFYEVTYLATGKHIVFGDTNYRNFIVSDKIYGFDFEDSSEGNKECDFARICAHLLKYSPEETEWKKEVLSLLIQILTEEFGYEKHIFINEIVKQLEIIDLRRQLKDSFQ